MTPGSVQTAKRRIVHLGNVGGVQARRTAEFAARFPQFEFIGIDVKKARPNTANWIQFKGDFVRGLKHIPLNSIDLVSSELAVGYYGVRPHLSMKRIDAHAVRTIAVAYLRLKKGGKLLLVVTGNPDPTELAPELRKANFVEHILSDLAKTRFDPYKIVVREATRKEYKKFIELESQEHPGGFPGAVYIVTATK